MTEITEQVPSSIEFLLEANAGEELKVARARIAELEAEQAEHEASFNLNWEAEMRGVALWREGNPGHDLVMPDKGEMVAWLLDEMRSLETLKSIADEANTLLTADLTTERAARELAEAKLDKLAINFGEDYKL